MHQACGFLPDDAALPDIATDPVVAGLRPIRVADFRQFMTALTASEEFPRFLSIMFASVAGTLRDSVALSDAPNVAGVPHVGHEIEVAVPDGAWSGQTMAVEFLGSRYELAVPEGCAPGMCFRASVALPQPTGGYF